MNEEPHKTLQYYGQIFFNAKGKYEKLIKEDATFYEEKTKENIREILKHLRNINDELFHQKNEEYYEIEQFWYFHSALIKLDLEIKKKIIYSSSDNIWVNI